MRVSSLEFMNIQSMIDSFMIKWEKCNVKMGLGDPSLPYTGAYWWKRYGVEVWAKSALSKSAFYTEIETQDLLLENRTV